MKTENKNMNAIEKFLCEELCLCSEQYRCELDRFERHPDIREELIQALTENRIQKSNHLTVVCPDGNSYTAEMLFESGFVNSVYAAYSLLTQLREHPELSEQIQKGLKIK